MRKLVIKQMVVVKMAAHKSKRTSKVNPMD